MFFGRYDYTIDAKGRLNFPAKFRDAMGESFVVLEWVDSCLFALPMEEVERLADKLESDELMDSWAISGDLFSTACEVAPDKQKWAFHVEPLAEVMVGRLVADMKASGDKTVGFIGFSDSWGELLLKAINKTTEQAGIKVVALERFGRTDTSVAAQALKILAAKPDAVFVGGAGTPAAMPSSTAPTALPWLSPKMVSERSLPKVFFMAYSSTPSRGRRPSTGMVSARQQPRPGTLITVIWPPWAFLSCSISASTFSLL